MKKIYIIALSLIGLFGLCFGENAKVECDCLGYMSTNFDESKQRAIDESKVLVLRFEGSQWCPPCQMLDKLVIKTPEFEKYALKNIIMVNVDVYRDGRFADEKFRDRYTALMKEYEIRAFPTMILIDPKTNRKEVMVGMLTKTPAELIAKIEAFKQADGA